MSRSIRFSGAWTFAGSVALLLPTGMVSAQEGAAKRAGSQQFFGRAVVDPELQSIHDAYEEGRLQLERRRLESLGRLAARQDPKTSARTFEELFRLAIANNLFVAAEPFADEVLKKGGDSATTKAFATLVKLIAECDRGAFDQSLETLRRAVEETRSNGAGADDKVRPNILASEKARLCDLYYQKLVHEDRFDVAKKAFQLLKPLVRAPELVDLLTNRLKRLEMLGLPAPAIQGKDLDGRPFNLADAKGKVVLVVFWASWSLPCADEVDELKRVADEYRAKGFEIAGVNLDTLQDDGVKLESVMPSIRRFILDYNVTWPNLINGAGVSNFADAYGVTTIPSNTLIGKDGKIVSLDLVQKNLETVIARETAK